MIARYYGLPLGRNLMGMAIGFGVWVSVLTANNAMYDEAHKFLPYWRVLSQVSLLVMLCVWNWALFQYAPNPVITESEASVQDAELGAWTEHWNQTVSSARRIVQP